MSLTLHLGRREWSASWWMAALTLCGVVLFGSLGRWQWHRAEYKRALEEGFASQTTQLTALGTRATASLPRYAHVEAEGRYDAAHQFLLDNITHDGRAGYDVLTPLVLADGRTLLVDRGWIALKSRQALPDVSFTASTAAGTAAGAAAADAPTRVRGRIDELPVTGISLGRVAPATSGPWPRLTSFPTVAQLAQALGRPLQPQQLLLDTDQPNGYVRDWKPVTEGFGPAQHISYAVQWWGLAALAVVLFGVLNLRKTPRT